MISENAMTELTQEQRHEEALKKYIQDVPDLKDEIKDLSPDDQKDQIQWAFEDEAEAQGLQPWELTLKYTSTPEEFEAQRLVLHKEAAEVLGVEWEEYCEMNNLVV
ncbi:Dephospho-CoA kinase [Pseudomonas sp. IT-347P]